LIYVMRWYLAPLVYQIYCPAHTIQGHDRRHVQPFNLFGSLAEMRARTQTRNASQSKAQ
jgi:hypothetical protein